MVLNDKNVTHHDQIGFFLGMKRYFNTKNFMKFTTLILKNKNNMINSIDAKKQS